MFGRLMAALLVGGGLIGAATGAATAQSYPSKPVKVVVGYPPGGAVDATARLISERLTAALGQPVLVENRAGAGGQIAAEYVSKSDPDGHTLFFAVGGDMVWAKFLTRKKTVDPLTELTPIAPAISSVNCVVVSAASAYRSFKDLVAYAKQNPDKLTYGSAGVQSYYYLVAESMRPHGLSMLHVPYKGTGPIIAAMLSGEIEVGLLPLSLAAPQAAAGKVRILAVFEGKRYSGAPDVPAIKEELPSFAAPQSWYGFFGPPGMPAPMVERLNAEVGKIVQTAEMGERIRALSLEPMIMSADQLRPFIVASTKTYSDIIAAGKIQPVDD